MVKNPNDHARIYALSCDIFMVGWRARALAYANIDRTHTLDMNENRCYLDWCMVYVCIRVDIAIEMDTKLYCSSPHRDSKRVRTRTHTRQAGLTAKKVCVAIFFV